ncbi:MAG: hypothetical protein JZU65_23985 [Chlorobium sp.]|nr:hypothetical protein [Chlorobium sp.]
MKTWNILSLLALFFMVLIPSSFAADLPTKVDRPVIKVGDTWTYHKSVGTNTDTVTSKVVSLQPGGGYEVEVQSETRGKWVEKYDPSGNVIEDGKTIYSPSREIFRFPLEVGKLYSGSEFTRKSKKDPTVTATSQAKIKSITQDKLVVKAGTFNTLKVEVELPYDGRTNRGNSVSSRVDDTYWYSPEVGRWVKRHYNDLHNPGLEILELESFKRGQ